MADNKQGFLSYLWDQVKQGFESVKNTRDWLVRGVSNKLAWDRWAEGNVFKDTVLWLGDKSVQADSISAPSASIIQNVPTLNDIAIWNTSGSVQVPDLAQPNNLLWLNSAQWQEDINIDEPVTLSQVVQQPKWLTAREIIEWAWVKNSVDVLTEEEKLKDEGRQDTLKGAAQSVGNFFTKTLNPAYWGRKVGDWAWKESEYQKGEDSVAVWYNPDNWNILQLAINEWQGLTDDFWDTLFNKVRHKWNEERFDKMYSEYQNVLNNVYYSNLSDDVKGQLMQEAFNSFKKEVEDRELIKVYANDFYSDWLVAPIFTDAKWVGRTKNKFSQEELDSLAKSNIKEWGIYKLSDEQFQAFLDSYKHNDELYSEVWGGWNEDEETRWGWLDDNSKWEAMAAQEKIVLDWANRQLNAMVDSGRITPVQRNQIENRLTSEMRDRIENMWLYLDWPLSYYRLVSEKNPWDLTNWERAILWYGPWIINFMEDYTNALSKWAEETVRTGIDDGWELAKVPDSINGMSINDFFNNAIKDSNIQAGWIELLATESAIDAMQLINQNINHLYWQGKWNFLRRNWSEAGYWAWSYWYTAAELWQMWINYLIGGGLSQQLWVDLPARADRWQDYHRADWLTASLVETADPTILWSSDLWRLLKEYGLELTDIAWETAWTLLAEKPFLWATWNAAKKTRDGIRAAQKGIDNVVKTQQEVSKLTNLYNNAKNAIWNTKIVWWARNYINNVINNISPQASARTRAILELSKNGLRRIANDQIIDSTLTYLDTESFSTPSFWLSIWLTSATELLPALLKDAQLGKMIMNKIRWVGALDNTWWKMLEVMTSDDDVMKAFGRYFWTTSPTYRQLRVLADNGWWNFENALKQMYNQLNPEAKLAMNNFSKQVIADQVSRLTKLDWNSSYGRNLRALIDANWTNVADVWKWIFGIPWKVDVWGFTSSILFKEWADIQTRYLKKWYDVALDNIDGGFRSKLQNWFTRADIEQIAWNTPYKSVIKDWDVNKNFFEIDENWKYILNWEWAKALWLDVAEYTESMAKADLIRKEAEWTRAFLNENIQKLAEWKWISKGTIDKVINSWAFNKMVDELERIVC